MVTDKLIIFVDEDGKQIDKQFRTGWGCPIGCKVCFQGRGTWVVTKRVELGEDRLIVTAKKITKEI